MRYYQNFVMVIVLLLTVVFVLPATALPPKMEADRLLLSAAKHLGSPEATVEFEKIQNLKIELPTDYFYYFGVHLFKNHNLQEANKNIEKYLEKAGREGEFYKNSLQLITAIEKLNRFVYHGDGTVSDTRTGLMWAAHDNGRDIIWVNAKAYCANYKGGGYTDWRLPTLNEMAELHKAGISIYNINGPINVSNYWVWACETHGSEAAFFRFDDGRRGWYSQTAPLYAGRALAVRSDK